MSAGTSAASGRRGRLTWIVVVCLTVLASLSASASARTLYLAGNAGVAALNLNSDGTLSPLTGSPFPTGGTNPDGLALTPDGTKLYVANQGSNNVTGFRVTANGGLESVGPPVASGANGPIALVVTPDGAHLYVVNTSNSVSGFTIAADGSLTPITESPFSTLPTITSPRVPSVSADGRLLFVPGNGSTNVAAMAINADGTLGAPGTPAPTGGTGVVNTALAPNANRVYVNNWFTNSIAAFDFDTNGALTPVTGSPFPTGVATNPMGLRPSLDGSRLYTTLIGSEQVAALPIGLDGAVGAGPAVAAGADDPAFLAQTTDGLRLYVADGVLAANNVSGFDIAPGGTLTPITGSPFPSGAGGLDFESIATSPNQGPTADLAVVIADRTLRGVAIDAGGSTDADGSIATYAIDWGDGTIETGASPIGGHAYAAAGVYTVTVTVTDNEGCSTSIITTGQTVSCNGGARATKAVLVDVTPPADDDPPGLKLSGPRSQKLGAIVRVRAACDEACTAIARGSLFVITVDPGGRSAAKTRRFKLKSSRRALVPGVSGRLNLRIPAPARSFASSAFEQPRTKVSARIRVVAKDPSANATRKARRVGLRP